MRFQILSDLHLEVYKSTIPLMIARAPYLFLAGDIGNLSNLQSRMNLETFFSYVSDNWERVFYITGNHEYYHSTDNKDQLDQKYLQITQKYPNIDFLNLQKKPIYLENENVEILGCTLWSNPTPIQSQRCNDLKVIKYFDTETQKNIPIGNDQFCKWHFLDREYLENTLQNNYKDKKRIVMTHFLPLTNKDIPNSRYPFNPEAYYFGNRLESLIPKTDLWISGHTHEPFDIMKGHTRWICNPFGYPGENETTGEETVFEI